MPKAKTKKNLTARTENYSSLVGNISSLLESARKTSARVVNTILTANYWEIGRRIIEFEQKGSDRAQYGNNLLKNLSIDLKALVEVFQLIILSQ